MKKINIRKLLVPIDFSSNSMNALQTAAAIAKRHEAAIHLLYVDDNDYDLFTTDSNLKPPRLPEYMKMLTGLSKSIINQDEVKCSYSAETGSVTHCILKTAIEMSTDLIIIGKNGTNGHSPEYAGSHACQVVEKSRIPVIVVPEGVTKYSFENILFPVRPLLSVPDKYDAIRSFILKSKPSITMLNLRNPDYLNELHIIHRLSHIMKLRLEKDDIPYEMRYYFKDSHFAEKIISMVSESENEFDLIVVTCEFDRQHRDFHIGHYNQKIIHQSGIPVLIIHPENAKLDKDILLAKLEKDLALEE